MTFYLRISIIYLAAAIAIVAMVRPNFDEIPRQLIVSVLGMKSVMSHPLVAGAILLTCVFPLVFRATRLAVARGAFIAILGYVLFFGAFFLLKTALPLMADVLFGARFLADEPLILIDRMVHFGTDPWVLTHGLIAATGWDAAGFFAFFYTTFWLAPSLLFPLFLAVWDRDEDRLLHFMKLYVFSWIILGNIIPLFTLAGGPVYVERLHGLTDFAGLHAALEQTGMAASTIGWQQNWLWDVYESNSQGIGTGISAFPSGHLALATVIFLYLIDRQRLLWPLALVFLVLTQFVSVYSGYHYAVDGYVSILAVWGMHAWMRRSVGRNVAGAKDGL